MSKVKNIILSEYVVLLLSVVYLLALAPFTPSFLTSENFRNILITLLPLLIVAMGQTIVLITGGIDLSATSIIALSSITGAAVMNTVSGLLKDSAWAVPAAILAMALVGMGIGLANGLAIAKFRMPPFIVTLTTMIFFSGLAIWLTQSRNIGSLPPQFNSIGSNTWKAFLVAAALGISAHVMLSRSLWGRWLYAVGHNQKTAYTSGVPVDSVVISAYVVGGLFAAMASMLYTGQAESGSPILGQRLMLDIVGAAVIGGTSLFGGKGKIMWTVFGVLFIKLIDNTLNLLDLSFFTIMMVKGGVILLAALLDTLRTRLISSA